jgi:hypothetical protein
MHIKTGRSLFFFTAGNRKVFAGYCICRSVKTVLLKRQGGRPDEKQEFI